MDWGCAQYTKELPYANHAMKYNFRPGQSGKLVLEFWITPFDYAGCEGPERAIESVLTENKLIGLSWAVIDYDDVNSNKRKFWNLSHKQTFFGNASELVGFRLMPLEPQFRKDIEAQWSFKVIDADQRIVAFKDRLAGRDHLVEVGLWRWDDFERNRIRRISTKTGRAREGIYTVILDVTGPEGTSRMAKVWDVHVRG